MKGILKTILGFIIGIAISVGGVIGVGLLLVGLFMLIDSIKIMEIMLWVLMILMLTISGIILVLECTSMGCKVIDFMINKIKK